MDWDLLLRQKYDYSGSLHQHNLKVFPAHLERKEMAHKSDSTFFGSGTDMMLSSLFLFFLLSH